MELVEHANGSYRFLPGLAPYSAGVVAAPGHRITWFSLRRPLTLEEGIAHAATTARARGRAPDRLCAIALRSGAPSSLEGFAHFNRHYRELLAEHGVLGDGPNPIARTNVVPLAATPDSTVVHGFAVAEQGSESSPSFVVAGAAELRDQELAEAAIVAPGDLSEAGLHEKCSLVLAEMGRRLRGLGVDWQQVTAVDVYTRHSLTPMFGQLLAPLGEHAMQGIRWFPATPPLVGLDFEMDVRGTRCEVVLD